MGFGLLRRKTLRLYCVLTATVTFLSYTNSINTVSREWLNQLVVKVPSIPSIDLTTTIADQAGWEEAWTDVQEIWKRPFYLLQAGKSEQMQRRDRSLSTTTTLEQIVSIISTSILPKPFSAELQQSRWDASIIITSNLIPSFPSTSIITSTLYSLHEFLEGLPLDTPIYIAMDTPYRSVMTTGDNLNRLQEHIHRLQTAAFSPLTNIHIVAPMDKHRNLAANVQYTLERYVHTPFVYVLQHDMPFKRPIQHSALIEAMKRHPQILNNVRFRLNNGANTQGTCQVHKNISSFNMRSQTIHLVNGTFQSDNGLDFYVSDFWSDNNHIAATVLYKEMLQRFPHIQSCPMETYMMAAAKRHCNLFGQQLYGSKTDGAPFIRHLDGRKAEGGGNASSVTLPQKAPEELTRKPTVLHKQLLYNNSSRQAFLDRLRTAQEYNLHRHQALRVQV